MSQQPNKGKNADPLLKNIANALYFTTSSEVAIRTGITGNINITGPVTIPGTVTVDSTPSDPVHVHVTELTSGTVSLSASSLAALENITVTGTVSVSNFPTTSTVYQGTTPWVIKEINTATDISIADSNYEMNIARGLVTGQYVETKNGYVTGLNANDESTIWGEATAYPWSSWTTEQKLYIISTSASDTGQTLFIDGLDGNFNKITETVTTNGLTAVATTKNFFRINHCYLIAGNTNVGKITQRLTSGTGTVVGSMAIGFGRNKGGFFTVPIGYTAYIMYGAATQFRGGAGNIGGVVKMYTRTPAVPVGPFLLQYIAEVVNGQFRDEFAIPLAIPQKTDIDVRIVADGNGTQATCAWQMILVPN